jgi:hypothetical protein
VKAKSENFTFGHNSAEAAEADAEEFFSLVTYARVEPGEYTARIVKVQGPEYIRKYGRYGLRVEFELEETGELVSAFYRTGTRKDSRLHPRHKIYRLLMLASDYGRRKVGPKSLANPDVVYRVRVDWCESKAYSVVAEVLGLEDDP